jgi:3-oxoadipate enol-lactonase
LSKLQLDKHLTINFTDEGRGAPLLLFNGATLPLDFWDPVVAGLMAHRRIIRFDQRNAGRTAFDGIFTLNDTAADAAAVLDAVDVDSAIIVGHAWGGRAAQVFARDYPHRTDALVICGTGGQHPARTDPAVLAAMRDAFRQRRRPDWEAGLAETYCASGFRERAPDRFQALADLLWETPPNSKARWDPQVSPSASYWGATEKPALLIYGREDRNGTLENAEDLASRLRDGRLHFIDGAGHFVIRETPEIVVQHIGAFLEELAA